MAATAETQDGFNISLKDCIEFQELVYHLPINDNFSKAKDLIPHFNALYAQKLICEGANCNPLHFLLYSNLFQCTGTPRMLSSRYNCFSKYLMVKGLIPPESFDEDGAPDDWELNTIETYEQPIKSDSIWSLILNDDITSFVTFITVNNVDIKQENELWLNDHYFANMIEFASYCGSINIIKYLIINNVSFNENSLHFLIQGNSEPCIEYAASIGNTFDNTLEDAIKYHHNELAIWIYKTYSNNAFKIPKCGEEFNSAMLCFFIKECNQDKDQKDNDKKTSLHWAVINQDPILIKYLIDLKIDLSVKDNDGKCALDYAYTPEIINLFPK